MRFNYYTTSSTFGIVRKKVLNVHTLEDFYDWCCSKYNKELFGIIIHTHDYDNKKLETPEIEIYDDWRE